MQLSGSDREGVQREGRALPPLSQDPLPTLLVGKSHEAATA